MPTRSHRRPPRDAAALPSWRDGFLASLRLGTYIGVALALLACVAWAVTLGRVTTRLGTTLPAVATADVAGGALGGAIVGLGARWVTSWWRAALLGVATAAPLSVMVRVALRGSAPADGADWVVLPIWAVAMGSMCGVGLWRASVRVPLRRPGDRGRRPSASGPRRTAGEHCVAAAGYPGPRQRGPRPILRQAVSPLSARS